MVAFIIIQGILLVTLFLLLIRYHYEVKALQKQLTYKIQSKSGFVIASSIRRKEIRELLQTVNQLFDEVSKSRRALDQKDKQMQMMLSGITHDIRTPLTSIQGYLTLWKESENELEKESYMQIIAYRLQLLRMMLENMFMDAKLNDEDYQIELSMLQPYPILCKVLASFYHEFEEKGMELSITFENQQMIVQGNEELLTRVFQNLIHNALQHGTKYIAISQNGNEILFANGILAGNDLEIDKVFDRFYVQDASRSKGSSGLGLSITNKIMRKLNGRIQAEKTEKECGFLLQFQE